MAALTLEAVYRALKRGELAPVYYLTGEAEVLKDELAAAIGSAAVEPASRDFNYDARSAGDLDGEALHALVETPPMLADRRVVVVRGLEQWRANVSIWQVLLRYLERPSPSTVLILVHGAGEKANPAIVAAAQHVPLDALTPDLLGRWVGARAERAGLIVEPDAVKHLIDSVGADLGALSMEIEKLAAACAVGESIGVARVSQMVGVRRGETLHDWLEAVLFRDAVRAVELLDVVLQQPGGTGVRLVSAVGTALLGTRLARSLADAGSSPRQVEDQVFRHLRQTRPPGVGLWSEEAKLWTRAAAAWSAAELDDALRTAAEADRALKTSGLTDERGTVAALLLRIAPRRVAA